MNDHAYRDSIFRQPVVVAGILAAATISFPFVCVGAIQQVPAAAESSLQERVKDLREQVIQLQQQVWTKAAEAKAIEDENKILERAAATQSTHVGSAEVPAEYLGDGLQQLKATLESRNADLRRIAQAADAASTEILQLFAKTERDLGDVPGKVFELETAYGTSIGSGSGWFGVWFGPAMRPIWVSGCIALAAALGLILHQSRQDVRKRLRPVRNRTRGRVAVTTASVFCLEAFVSTISGCSTRRADSPAEQRLQSALQQEQQELSAELQRLKTEFDKYDDRLKTALSKNNELYTRNVQSWMLQWTTAGKQGPISDAALKGLEDEARDSVRRFTVSKLVREMAGERTRERLDALEKASQRLRDYKDQFGSAATATNRKRQVTVGSTFLATELIFLGIWFLLTRARATRQSRTCPQCLAVGRLEQVPDPNPDPRFPEVTALNCKECDYQFRSRYSTMPRVCFPTLGIPRSGKTHWLAMVYHQLNLGSFPDGTLFEKTPSMGYDGTLDQVVDDLLKQRQGPDRTQFDSLPRPLVFHLRDADALGLSDALLNVFDFSGEVVDAEISDEFRKRALQMDGFVFFVDPRQSMENQNRALMRFREDLREIKGVSEGKPIRVPVAVCISKIDLLTGISQLGGSVLSDFIANIRKTGPTNGNATLSAIRKRSKLCSDFRETIFPGWQLEKQMKDLFAGQFMFFPLTPVGLEELGEDDLSKRTIAPFGILEPLLWLLHMNGFKVLR
jgi:uncharacterized protein YlxW (UPF0749 family)